MFSNVLKAPFIKSESKPFSSDALSKEKANFLETIASTEKPENKTDKVSLSQPVSASKHEYSDNFPVSLSQPSKKSFANHTEDEQIEKKEDLPWENEYDNNSPGKNGAGIRVRLRRFFFR